MYVYSKVGAESVSDRSTSHLCAQQCVVPKWGISIANAALEETVNGPVAVGIRQQEKESQDTKQIGMVVPGRLLKQQYEPVRQKEHQAADTEHCTQHDTSSTWTAKLNDPVMHQNHTAHNTSHT